MDIIIIIIERIKQIDAGGVQGLKAAMHCPYVPWALAKKERRITVVRENSWQNPMWHSLEK